MIKHWKGNKGHECDSGRVMKVRHTGCVVNGRLCTLNEVCAASSIWTAPVHGQGGPCTLLSHVQWLITVVFICLSVRPILKSDALRSVASLRDYLGT